MEKSNDYSEMAKKIKFDVLNYVNTVLGSSTNYAQRFGTFLAFTQLLYLLMFIIVRIFMWFGWFNAIPFSILVCFGAGVFFLVIFLFKGVEAKALTFFSVGITYLIISILIARTIGTDFSFSDMSLMGGLSVWNMTFSIIILLIGTVRTFALGFIHDYKKK